jgi:hypothetical protein
MKKTNIGLLEYAKAQVGLAYWYGTYGKIASESLYKAKKKQYPAYYTSKDFPSQYGKRVHDCVGLIKGYLWSDSPTGVPKYNSAQDKSAKGMYNAAVTKGGNSTFPGKPGILVFKTKTTGSSGIHHVGIYDGEGYVYEAKGHAYGVVKTKYKAEDWKYWAQCPYTEADEEKTTEDAEEDHKGDYTMEMRNLKKGCKGEDVKALQILLIGRGYSCGKYGADGDFGDDTRSAVKKYQKDKELEVDGIAGKQTMGSLLGVI